MSRTNVVEQGGRHVVVEERETESKRGKRMAFPGNRWITYRRTNGQKDKRTEGQPDRRTTGQKDKRTEEQTDRRTNGQKDSVANYMGQLSKLFLYARTNN